MKRFKPSPVTSDDNSNGSTNSLKIRLSRYGSSPARSQETPKEAVKEAVKETKARVTRGNSKESSGDEAVKTEKIDGVSVKMCEVRMSALSSVKLEGETDSKDAVKPPHYDINVNMTAQQIISECERVGPGSAPISTSVMEDQHTVPRPKRRHQLPKLTKEQLLPPTPSVHVRSKQEAFSPQLLEWCLQRPITVIRGLAQACDIDLSLYTTKTLAATNPNHPVEIRTQLEQNSDENWDPSLSQEVTIITLQALQLCRDLWVTIKCDKNVVQKHCD